MSQYLKDRQVNRSMTYEAKPFWKSTDNWNFYGLSRCLKIIKKSHSTMRAKRVFILSGQKFVKNGQNSQFLGVFGNLKLELKTVLPDRSLLISQKLVENAIIEKYK